MDVVRLHQAGISYAVADAGHRHHAGASEQDLQNDSEVVFRFDGDRAGLKARVAGTGKCAAAGQRRARIEFMFLPEATIPTRWLRKKARRPSKTGCARRCRSSEYLVQQLMPRSTWNPSTGAQS